MSLLSCSLSETLLEKPHNTCSVLNMLVKAASGTACHVTLVLRLGSPACPVLYSVWYGDEQHLVLNVLSYRHLDRNMHPCFLSAQCFSSFGRMT